MGLSAYYKTWYLQELREVPSPFPPTWNTPTWEYGDSREVKGFFRQDQSKETLIAAAQDVRTLGRFACHSSENLLPGDVLRSVELGVFIRLEGDALETPKQATVQVKTFAAYVTSRTTEEQAARRFAGIGD